MQGLRWMELWDGAYCQFSTPRVSRVKTHCFSHISNVSRHEATRSTRRAIHTAIQLCPRHSHFESTHDDNGRSECDFRLNRSHPTRAEENDTLEKVLTQTFSNGKGMHGLSWGTYVRQEEPRRGLKGAITDIHDGDDERCIVPDGQLTCLLLWIRRTTTSDFSRPSLTEPVMPRIEPCSFSMRIVNCRSIRICPRNGADSPSSSALFLET